MQSTTKTLYVSTVYWRNCDTLFSVAGWSKSAVGIKASRLADEELENAVEQEYFGEDADSLDENEVRMSLNDDLIVTRVHAFDYPNESLAIPKENQTELEQDGITVY